jgi:hypothetical protein
MKIFFTCFSLVAAFCFRCTAEEKEKESAGHKQRFYFYWGYNRAYYSKTNLHFNGPNYDFTLYRLTAHDRPSKFGLVYFNPATFTVPQYNYRIGYFITEHLSISGGMDHMKYVVDQDQMTTISGIVTPQASQTYQGTYLHDSIQLTNDILMFEHTNGFNLESIEFEYLFHITKFGKHFSLKLNTGFGGIWIIPKTDVRVFGDGLDNDFHVAGYTFEGKAGPRLEFKNKFFFAVETKCGYASLPYVLIKNSAPEVSDHNVIYYEWYGAAGMYFPIHFKKKNKRNENCCPGV